MLLAWAQLFRHEGTYANYLGYVRTGCMLANAECTALDDPAVKRAKASIKKSQQFQPRERMWIRRELVERLMLWSLAHPAFEKFAKLWLLAYAFLLRLPSEALPAFAGEGDHQSALFMEGSNLVLVLKRRKNKPGGSRLVRTCWCSESKVQLSRRIVLAPVSVCDGFSFRQHVQCTSLAACCASSVDGSCLKELLRPVL